MGREVRRVRADWEHPRDGYYQSGEVRYHSLLGGSVSKAQAEWDEANAKWNEGFRESYKNYPEVEWVPRDEDDTGTYAEYAGERPDPKDYMPEWSEEEMTHIMMYETCSEGSPISPAFPADQPEALARWLVDNNASAFGSCGAPYEGWLNLIKSSGWAVSAVIVNGQLMSGVEAQLR